MGRLKEAFSVAVFAGVIAIPALIAFGIIFEVASISFETIKLFGLLGLAGVAAAFFAALLVLPFRPLDTPIAGAMVGILAAGIFYCPFVFIVSAVTLAETINPDVAAILSVHTKVFLRLLAASWGIPFIAGIGGGIGYVLLKRRYGAFRILRVPPSELD